MDAVGMVANMSEESFQEVVKVSPRKIRETLFGRLGIKAKKKTVGIKVHGKLEDRTRKLHARLKEAQTQQEQELCMELLRNCLYTKRPLLKDTLDYLEVKNDNGLIDEEPTFFQELDKEKVEAMVKHLRDAGHEEVAISVYLRFVDCAHVDDVLGPIRKAA